MTCATVDWETAEVNRAKLQVELRGELPSSWKKSFTTTTRMPDDQTDADEQVASNGDEAGPDERMTQRFRAFSSQANDGEPGAR
jgi:hypothetical protein